MKNKVAFSSIAQSFVENIKVLTSLEKLKEKKTVFFPDVSIFPIVSTLHCYTLANNYFKPFFASPAKPIFIADIFLAFRRWLFLIVKKCLAICLAD